MSTVPQKLELPSITRKKQEEWAEMDSLYNTCYNSLTSVVTTVGSIVAMKEHYPETVDEVKLTNMVGTLNQNLNKLRQELNDIHSHVESTRHTQMDMMDVNMECIQISSQYKAWGDRFTTLCGQPLGDIISYVEQ